MIGIDQIKKKVKNHEIYVLGVGGSERALIDDTLSSLRAEILSKELYDLNYHQFIVGENDLDNLMMALYSAPWLANQRLVEVHGAEKLPPAYVTSIIEYIKKPSISSLLVLVFNKVDKKTKLVTELFAQGLFCSCEINNEADRMDFLLAEARACELNINQKAAQFLLLITNGDLLLIKNAIEKLSLLCIKEITIDDIEKQIVDQNEQDVFKLARAISEGRLSEALYALGILRNNQENAIKFLGVLMWQFRVLLHIRHCQEQEMPAFDIRKEVGVFGDRFLWMEQVAKRGNLAFHINRLVKLLECDLALKSQNISEPLTLIEKVVYQSAIGLVR